MTAQEALNYVHNELGLTWRKIAKQIGCYSDAYWLRVARGDIAMSVRADNALRRKLGLPARSVARIADMTPAQLARSVRDRTEMILDKDDAR